MPPRHGDGAGSGESQAPTAIDAATTLKSDIQVDLKSVHPDTRMREKLLLAPVTGKKD